MDFMNRAVREAEAFLTPLQTFLTDFDILWATKEEWLLRGNYKYLNMSAIFRGILINKLTI
jgi:hypothetical protein